jgi:hypothetical protein
VRPTRRDEPPADLTIDRRQASLPGYLSQRPYRHPFDVVIPDLGQDQLGQQQPTTNAVQPRILSERHRA